MEPLHDGAQIWSWAIWLQTACFSTILSHCHHWDIRRKAGRRPAPSPQPTSHRPCQSLGGPALGRTWAHSACSASPGAQGMAQVALSTGPSLLAFHPAQPLHSWSPAPFVTPSSAHSAAGKTSCLLQAPQAPRRGAATPRPGSFATTCKGKFSTYPHGQELGSAPTGTRDSQPSRCLQINITCLLGPTEGGPASAEDDNKQGTKNKWRKTKYFRQIFICNTVKTPSKS